MDKICQKVTELAESIQESIWSISDRIWENPETGFEEYISSQVLQDALAHEGFRIESDLAGMKTAFRARYGSGHPVIGFLGEFDALSGMSQAPNSCTQKTVIEGGAGHGCGHHALGAGSLAAALLLKTYMEQENRPGTVIFYGCPAEETGCGKSFMARDGIFSDLDVAFTWHPDTKTQVCGESSLADFIVRFEFTGTPAHAAAAPHHGRSALDAAELMNIGTQFLREHIVDEARIHYAFLDTGGTASNVVQSSAVLCYDIRAPKIDQVRELYPRVLKIAEGAALMTETSMKAQIVSTMCDFQPNSILSSLMDEALQQLGNVPFSSDSCLFAEQIRETLTEAEKREADALVLREFSKQEADLLLKKPLLAHPLPYRHANQCMPGSTDVGDVSYVVPTAQLYVTCAARGTSLHSWQMVSQGAGSISHEGLIHAAKVMSASAIRLLDQPDLLQKAKEEHRRIIGDTFISPLPADLNPTVIK